MDSEVVNDVPQTFLKKTQGRTIKLTKSITFLQLLGISATP